MTPKLSFDTPIYALAPLAGYTDLPFRNVVKKFGADLTVSEIIEVDGLALTIQFDDGRTKKLNAEYARLEKI